MHGRGIFLVAALVAAGCGDEGPVGGDPGDSGAVSGDTGSGDGGGTRDTGPTREDGGGEDTGGADVDAGVGDADAGGDAGPPPETCGNDRLDEGEVCDGTLLGGETCQSVLGWEGSLACAASCLEFDTSGCTCRPRTCDPMACGTMDDGCGGTLDCGETCIGTLTCGGAGQAGRCGQSCTGVVCPAGSTCDADGVCQLTNGLDFSTAFQPVTLVARFAGSAAPDCEDVGLELRPEGTDIQVPNMSLTCSGAQASTVVWVPPGRYTVRPRDLSRSLFLRTVSFEVQAQPLTVDVPIEIYRVGGRVLHNGSRPVRHSICDNPRTATSRLRFTSAHGAKVVTPVDCRNSFRIEPVGLEAGTHQVELLAMGVEFDVVNIGEWGLELGTVTIQADEADRSFELRTYHVDGVLSFGGDHLTTCTPGELIVSLDGYDTRRQSRHAYTCDASGRVVVDVDLPFDTPIQLSLRIGTTSWLHALAPLNADTTNLDLPGGLVVASGAFTRGGQPIPCEGRNDVQFTADAGPLRRVLTRAVCENDVYVLPRMSIPQGKLIAYLGNFPFELTVQTDRLDTPIPLEPMGEVRGTIRGLSALACSQARVTSEDARLSTNLDCSTSPPSYQDTAVRVGTWPLILAVGQGERTLGTVTVQELVATNFDGVAPWVDEGDVQLRFSYGGTDVSLGDVSVFSDDIFTSGTTNPLPLPGHFELPQRELWWSLGEPSGVTGRWIQNVSFVPQGEIRLDVSPTFISGQVRISGARFRTDCTTRLGEVQLRGASGPLRCDGSFGPIPASSGVGRPYVNLDTGATEQNALVDFYGPVVGVP